MSNIIYLKDILLAKASKKKNPGRPKLKPFNKDTNTKTRSTLKSSLVECKRDTKDGMRQR